MGVADLWNTSPRASAENWSFAQEGWSPSGAWDTGIWSALQLQVPSFSFLMACSDLSGFTPTVHEIFPVHQIWHWEKELHYSYIISKLWANWMVSCSHRYMTSSCLSSQLHALNTHCFRGLITSWKRILSLSPVKLKVLLGQSCSISWFLSASKLAAFSFND